MATFFSDHFGPQVAAGLSAITVPRPKIPWGINHKFYKRCAITLPLTPTAFTIADVARLMTFKSSDRIVELFITASGPTALAADIGLYLTGQDHNGGTPSGTTPLTLFGSAVAMTALARVDEFLESGVSTNLERGQTLWELLALSADPVVEYDLSFTCTTTLTVALGSVVVEAFGSFS